MTCHTRMNNSKPRDPKTGRFLPLKDALMRGQRQDGAPILFETFPDPEPNPGIGARIAVHLRAHAMTYAVVAGTFGAYLAAVILFTP